MEVITSDHSQSKFLTNRILLLLHHILLLLLLLLYSDLSQENRKVDFMMEAKVFDILIQSVMIQFAVTISFDELVSPVCKEDV